MSKKGDLKVYKTVQAWISMEEDSSLLIKPQFIEMTGDFIAGAVFSQIFYWYKPSKNNGKNSKLRVEKHGHFWIAKQMKDWQDEMKLPEKRFKNALDKLISQGFIEKKVMKYAGENTLHIRIIEENVEKRLQEMFGVNGSDEEEKAKQPKGTFTEDPQEENHNLPELIAKLGVLKYPPLKHTLDILTSNVKLTDNLHKLAHDGKTQSQAKLFIAFMNKQARVPKKEEFDLLIELKDTYQPKQLEKALKDIGKVENISTMKKEIEEIATKEKENTENKYVPKKMYQKPEKKQTVDSFSEYDLEALN